MARFRTYLGRTPNWALTDNQGSIEFVLDNNGNIVNQITYDSFGQITNETNSSIDFRFDYTGRELDKETGLRYYRARYLDSDRFISEDPIEFSAGDTNLYRYVNNSPTNAIDPSGLQSVVAPPPTPTPPPVVTPPPTPTPVPPPVTGGGLVGLGLKLLAATPIAAAIVLLWQTPVADGTLDGVDPDILESCNAAKKTVYEAKCKARYTGGENPPAHCPKFVYGRGSSRREAQKNAKLTAPEECRKFYGHCQIRKIK